MRRSQRGRWGMRTGLCMETWENVFQKEYQMLQRGRIKNTKVC